MADRWEYRVFAPALGGLRRALEAALEAGAEEEREDTYLVGPGTRSNVKLREGALDVKRRVATDRGLEQWHPEARVGLPVAGAWVRDALAAYLELGSLDAPRERYDRETLLREVVVPHPQLAPVALRKARRHYAGEGLRAEHARVAGAGLALETVAVESEDPERVLDAVAWLGLDRRPNESYVRRLRAHVEETGWDGRSSGSS